MVVFSKNPISSALYLVICFIGVAGHYLLLNSQFLFGVQIIVYAGAIMVLFLYVVMMLNMNKDVEPRKNLYTRFAAVVSGGLLFLVLVGALKSVEQLLPPESVDPNIGLIKNLGQVLFSDYLLPFELSSILFLGAMVGAVMIGKREAN